jgi:PucR-like helix-turn-helix protein
VSRDEVQGIVDHLADALKRSVVIDDPHVRMLYSSAHFGDEDPVRVEAILKRQADSKAIGHVLAQGVASWTRAGIIPANREFGMQARVCVPVRWRGELLALIIVMDADESVTTSELSAITDAAHRLAPLLADELSSAADDLAREQQVLDLVSPEPSLRRRALADLAAGVDSAGFELVTGIRLALPRDSPDGSPKEWSLSHVNVAMRSALTIPGPPEAGEQLCAVDNGTAVLLLGSRRPLGSESARAHAERMLGRLHDLSSGTFHAVAGVGPCLPGLDRAFETAELAGLAGRAAALQFGGAFGGGATTWEELGPYGPLLRIPESQHGRQVMPAEVQRLLAVDRDGQMATTLRTFLDAGCSAPAAAVALNIHKTTLYYRLGRIEELTGLDLADGRTRLTMHLGLTLMDLLGDFRHP